MHVVVTGGGSAGHVTPALAVAEVLRSRGATVSFVGGRSGLEEAIVAPRGLPYFGITGGKLRRYFSIENLIDAGRVLLGMWQAWRLLGRLRPDVVFSKGGFVAFPVVLAGWLRGVPVVVHESDFSPGLANRLSRPFTRVICTSFADTSIEAFDGEVVHTGSPVRRELMEGEASRGRELLGFDDTRPILLVTGGSLGAVDLNRAVAEALPQLLTRWQVVHVCGSARALPPARPGYAPFAYVDAGWGDMLACADLVVSRAGANAVFELLALRKLQLLVPLPATASRGDQIENAAYARSQGYCEVLRNEALTGDALVQALDALWAGRERFAQRLSTFHSPAAAERVAGIIQDLAAERS